MATSETPIAEQIAKQAGGDGQENAALVSELCWGKSGKKADESGCAKWVFFDQSTIIMIDEEWHIGFPGCDCWCSATLGYHYDECDRSE